MTETAPTPLFIRGLKGSTAATFRLNAAARLLTHAEYLEQLVELHEIAKLRAATDANVRRVLEDCGLEEVTA